uniref:Uncharacterized protein n=1 Tax=Ditylenchus dipsaci TaxID=166011 RepID=A0A915D6I8_9BILA
MQSCIWKNEFTRDVLDADKGVTNAVMVDRQLHRHNVVFVNGSEDPWHPPSVVQPCRSNNTVISLMQPAIAM